MQYNGIFLWPAVFVKHGIIFLQHVRWRFICSTTRHTDTSKSILRKRTFIIVASNDEYFVTIRNRSFRTAMIRFVPRSFHNIYSAHYPCLLFCLDSQDTRLNPKLLSLELLIVWQTFRCYVFHRRVHAT